MDAEQLARLDDLQTDPYSLAQRGEIVSNLQNLLIAAHLTTTALIGTALLHLLRDRPQWELLCAPSRADPGRGRGGGPVRHRPAGLPGLRLAPGHDIAMLPTMIHRSPRTLPVTL